MRVLCQIGMVALSLMLAGCSDHESVTLVHRPTVKIEPGLPASATNAVLQVRIHIPYGLPTNYASISGSRSLKSPVGRGSDSTGFYSEQRLVAIHSDGFVMLFTVRDAGVTKTNTVLFRYGETTETNTMGWKIDGHFK